MADCRADAGVIARPENGPIRRSTAAPIGSPKALDGLQPDPGPATRCEGEDAVVVAAGRQSVGENQQGLLLHVEHQVAVNPGVGRERDVNQQRDGEIVPLRRGA